MKDEFDPGTGDIEEAIGRAARPKAIGAWIFAGGFTLGVRKHFDVACHLEESNYGVATVRKNIPELPVHVGRESWPMEELKKHEWDFIYGNPPCAAWSQAGKVVFGADWRDDPRVDCTRRHFALLEELHPKFWVWESVPRALEVGRELVDQLAARAVRFGYGVTYLLHNARHLGVPQNRPRFFFVAHKIAFEPVMPEPFGYETCGELLRAINDPGEIDMRLSPEIEALFPRLRQGQSLRDLWESENPKPKRNARGQVSGRPPFTYHRLRAERPSNTVAGFYQVHPTEDRCLTTKEMAALCGFPADYEFEGSGACNQVARGVCPPVGAWLAGEVARSLREDRKLADAVVLADQRQRPGTRQALPVPTLAAVPEPEREEKTVAAAEKTARQAVVPRPAGSGAYIRELLAVGTWSPDQIVAMNLAKFPGSKATTKDVYWNKQKMRRKGAPPAAAPQPAAELPPPELIMSEPAVDAPQPTRSKLARPQRRFDKTALTESSHGYRVHRDYAAHFFRWGWASRRIDNTMSVLDIGCGQDYPFVKVLVGAYAKGVPRSYVGVDFNVLRSPPQRPWARFLGEFDFTARYAELGTYDAVINFEVIEHMGVADGRLLLAGMRECLVPNGKVFLSTPVFDGRAAANHVHEYTVAELAQEIDRAGLEVLERYGTFANYREIKKVCTPEQLATLDGINRFYSTDVSACFLAPLFPDASRNNVWVLGRKK